MTIEQRLAEAIRSFHLDSLSSSVPLNVDLDVVLSVLAAAICAALRRRLPGYHAATPDTLQRRFLSTTGTIHTTDDTITVRLDRRTYSPVLRASRPPRNHRPLAGQPHPALRIRLTTQPQNPDMARTHIRGPGPIAGVQLAAVKIGVSSSGALRAAVGRENMVLGHGLRRRCGRRLAGTVCADQRILVGVCSGRPRSVYGVTSLCVSLVVEGTVVCPREPWIVAVEHACQSPILIRPPRNTRPANQFEPGRRRSAGRKVRCVMEVVHPRCAGIDVSKTGREGVRPRSRAVTAVRRPRR